MFNRSELYYKLCLTNYLTINNKCFHIISSYLKFLLHGIKWNVLIFYCHSHEGKQSHFCHVLFMQETYVKEYWDVITCVQTLTNNFLVTWFRKKSFFYNWDSFDKLQIHETPQYQHTSTHKMWVLFQQL